MRTPAGIECSFFYGDYFRGKNVEECRLIGIQPAPKNWTPDLCSSCPVPAIIRANACPNMTLVLSFKKGFSLKKRRLIVTAYCTKSNKVVDVPQIGCGICHTVFEIKEDE
jgi:hypothetical protein